MNRAGSMIMGCDSRRGEDKAVTDAVSSVTALAGRLMGDGTQREYGLAGSDCCCRPLASSCGPDQSGQPGGVVGPVVPTPNSV